MKQDNIDIQKILTTKRVIEGLNNDVFNRRYKTNFSKISDYFYHEFNIRSSVLNRACLEFIHRGREKTSKRVKLFNCLSGSTLFCFVVVIFMAFLRRFTYIKGNPSANGESMSKFALIDRSNRFLYGDFLKDREGASLVKDFSRGFFHKQVRFNLCSVIKLFSDVRSGCVVAKSLDREQKMFFLEKIIECTMVKRFYDSIGSFDYIVDCQDNSYTPVQKEIANILDIDLILLQNGARVNLLEYGYIDCNIFLGWSNLYKRIVVGEVLCDIFLAIGSKSMSRQTRRETCKEYDFLIVEQLTYPDKGEASDASKHKAMIGKMIEFKKKHPQYRIVYLCRHTRTQLKEKIQSILLDNDTVLLENDIEILDRNFCECAVKNSKVSIALSSSIRFESYLVGNVGFSVFDRESIFDWVQQLFNKNSASLRDTQEDFDRKLLQSLKSDINLNNIFNNSSYSLSEALEKLKT